MTKNVLALGLLLGCSIANAAPPFYDFYLQEDIQHSFLDLAAGDLGKLEVCDQGLCGGFVVQTSSTRVGGEAFNINFSGYTPTGFSGEGHQFDVSPVLVACYCRGLSYVIANFAAQCDRFTYDFSTYAVVNGVTIPFQSGATVGKVVFWTIPAPVVPVPEPETLALLLAGLPAIVMARRWSFRRQLPERGTR